MNRLLVLVILMHLSGAFGDTDENKSVIEGDSVTLHINSDEIQGAEKLLWTFNGEEEFIAKINKEDNTNLVPGNDDKRFKDRLKLNLETGDLTITNMRTDNSGLYQLQITSRAKISYKKFDVTVSAITEPDQRSHWLITGPLLLVGLILLGGLFVVYKRCKNQRSNDEENF